MAEKEDEKKNGLFKSEGIYEDGPWKGLHWGEFTYEGVQYRMRQNTVDEGDTNYDACFDEKTQRFNARLNSRLNLSTAIVTPETTVDDMGAWSGVKLVALLRAWDKLNLLPAADTEGND